jgi:predicted AAA+ superfamily ATPase
LETSSIVYLVPPFYKNYSKRIIKSPKLYFVDTGLLCSLLKIRHPADLRGHPLYGSIFETFIVSEFLKAFLHAGERSPLYFWRDHTGHEVDLVLDFGSKICAVEIKAGKTISPDYFKSLKYFSSLKGFHGDEVLVYGGNDHYLRENVRIRTWWQVS